VITRGVVVRVPGKVNLQLSVGPLGSDGFHEVVSVFQAVSIFDDVTVRYAPEGDGITLTASGATSHGVPLDSSNLAYKAAELMIARYGTSKDFSIHLKKKFLLQEEWQEEALMLLVS